MKDLFLRYETLVELFITKGILLDRALDDLEQLKHPSNATQPIYLLEKQVYNIVDTRKTLKVEIEAVRAQLIAYIQSTDMMTEISEEENIISLPHKI